MFSWECCKILANLLFDSYHSTVWLALLLGLQENGSNSWWPSSLLVLTVNVNSALISPFIVFIWESYFMCGTLTKTVVCYLLCISLRYLQDSSTSCANSDSFLPRRANIACPCVLLVSLIFLLNLNINSFTPLLDHYDAIKSLGWRLALFNALCTQMPSAPIYETRPGSSVGIVQPNPGTACSNPYFQVAWNSWMTHSACGNNVVGPHLSQASPWPPPNHNRCETQVLVGCGSFLLVTFFKVHSHRQCVKNITQILLASD